jgi:hypothetical protein
VLRIRTEKGKALQANSLEHNQESEAQFPRRPQTGSQIPEKPLLKVSCIESNYLLIISRVAIPPIQVRSGSYTLKPVRPQYEVFDGVPHTTSVRSIDLHLMVIALEHKT